jgi:nucleoside 2-deoxyribosyltransferase
MWARAVSRSWNQSYAAQAFGIGASLASSHTALQPKPAFCDISSVTRPKPRCYIASPLGFTEAGRKYAAESLLPALATVVEPVDPWTLTAPEEWLAAERDGRLRQVALLAGQRNSEAIKASELLVAVLEGQELDSGTAAEVGFATGLGLTCSGLRTDLRVMGEPGVVVNLQVEAFIQQSGGSIHKTLEDLIAALR